MTARPTFFFLLALALTATVSTASAPAFAKDTGGPKETKLLGNEKPREFDGIGISEKLGVNMTQDLKVLDEAGQARSFAEFFKTGKPTSFSLVYYNCSGLCNLHLNGLFDAFRLQRWKPGKDFAMVVLSFDPKETPEMAAGKKANYLAQYDIPAEDAKGIHFLTADAAVIGKVTSDLGFSYKWLEDKNEWAHASAAVLVTPGGVTSRYLHGVFFDPKTFELSMAEVSQGKLGNIVDQLIWFCFKYDHQQSKYTIYASRLMKVGGGLIILVLGMMLVPYLRTIRKEA